MRKYFFRTFTFLFLLSFSFLSCETERMELEIVQEEQSNVIVEAVDFNSIPELSQALNGVSGKSKLARSYMEKGDAKFWIEEQDVLKLRDSVSNESYTVRVYSDDPSPKTFYNLVVTKRVDGNPIVPFVVEYNFENGDIFSFTEDEEKNFDGTVNIYSLEEFANSTGLNARDMQPVACFQDIGQRDNTVAGNTGSSSTGGSSGGSSTAGSTGSTGTVSVTRTHISVSTTYGTRGTVSVGQGTFYMPPLTSDKQDQKSAGIIGKDSNPCPEGWVSIPINVIEMDLKAILEELAPEYPIENLAQFLSCYDTSQSAVITIYANQPVRNSSASISYSGDVGHAFISISQNGRTSTFGFYPSGEGTKSAYGPSVMGNNGGDPYDVSLSRTVSGATLGRIIEQAISFPSQYNVYNYNCTDYALEIANLAGMNIANAWGVYPTGQGGDNPGKLGQILRLRNGANTNGGRAPSQNNGCN